MGRKFKIRDQEKLYFVTFTIVNWIDVYIRNIYREIIIDDLKYCQENKGLIVSAWCIMTSHVHLIIGTQEGYLIEDAIRDLKSCTSRNSRKCTRK
jgi:REP element-mobilizing transposase RayT